MCRDQKEGWTLDSMKERDAEMKRKQECLEGDTGRKREISRFIKIKNIKKQNLLYGCFKNDPHKR